MRAIGPIRLLRARRRGFAILMVVLVLVGLLIIGAPFAISMRQEELASINFAARIHARLTAIGALNLAKAQLERSHEYYERLEANAGASASPTVYNSPFVDSSGELRVDLAADPSGGINLADPKGTMWTASADDEQGKVNFKSAPKTLLTNLLLEVLGESLDPANPGSTRSEAIADQLVTYRSDHTLRSVLQLREAVGTSLSDAELHHLLRLLTLHSAPLVGEVSTTITPLHPVNINTCRTEVLRALLRGIRLKDSALPGQDPHLGVGLDTFTAKDADGNDVTWTDDFDELIARLHVFTRLAASVELASTMVTLDSAALLPDPVLGDPPTDPVEGFWISIEGDAVRYWKKEDSTLTIWYDAADPSHPVSARVDRARSYDPNVPVEVRLLFADIEHDLAGVLERLVDEHKLTPRSRSAILANAINPLGAQLEAATVTSPICCHSFNIYTIDASGIVNAPDGRELARYTVREVVQVAPQVDLEVCLENQEDFERSFQAALASRQATWPNATHVADVAPASVEPPPAVLVARHGRLGLEPFRRRPHAPGRFELRFDGPLFADVLRADTAHMPIPIEALTTVKLEGGDDCDLATDGLHIGVPRGTVTAMPPRTIVYSARVDDPAQDADGNPLNQDNIPHDRSYGDVQPFILSLWVKLDSDFAYGQDHFLFDLGHEAFSNRLALYYDATSDNGGDLVLRVCDSTIQETAAEVRYRVTDQTFQRERWYRLEAVVKGIHHNEMALLVNGQSVGRYHPCAWLDGNVARDALGLPSTNLVGADGTRVFKPYPWPETGAAVFGAEIANYSSVTGSAMAIPSVPDRGARGSQARAHAAGTRIELFGYDVRVTKRDNDTLQPLPQIAMTTAQLDYALPAAFSNLKVDDSDEENPDGSSPADSTDDDTDEYWAPPAACYQAATAVNADYVIPADGWLPLGVSEKWLIKPVPEPGDPPGIPTTLADSEDHFKQVIDYATLTPSMHQVLVWTAQQLSLAGARTISEDDGLGFLRVLKNPDDVPADDQEVLKFKKAGVVLVWRYHPDDGGKPAGERRMFAWYIGYVADFTRRCFDTGEPATAGGTDAKAIVENAEVRLDCVKTSDNSALARGIRGTFTTTYTVPGMNPPVTMTQIDTDKGRGIFELRVAGGAPFEWISFDWPSHQPNATSGQPEPNDAEEDLCAHKFVVGIRRAQQGRNPAGDPVAYAFPSGTIVMPVFFVASSQFSVGPQDDVTLTDATGQRLSRKIFHASEYVADNYYRCFTFEQLPGQVFAYAANPRLLKFPSGSLPIAPDTCFYLGSDTTCVNGDPDVPYTEEGDDRREDTEHPEPERPANATFADVRIAETSNNAARLWDWTSTGGAPEGNKGPRWVSFSFDSDAAPIPADLTPPFYARIGGLERIMPARGGDPPTPFDDINQPYRFLGHVGWPLAGYLKINDECMFYRKIYYNRTGGHGAKMLLPNGSLPKDTDGLALVLQPGEMTLYVDANQAADFPQQGYITIGNSVPSQGYWAQFVAIAGADPANQQALLEWLDQGNPLIGPNGQPMDRYGSISGEYMFYSSREDATVRGQAAVKLNLAYRGILNSTQQAVKVVDPDEPPAWFVGGASDLGSANVSLVGVEFMILERGCLGTAQASHPVGSVALPLDHLPASLAPRKMVKLKRGEDGYLVRNADGTLKADEWPDFDPAKREFEYGIVLEDSDGFPGEGYVQIGNEILGYCQDEASSTSLGRWDAKVPDAADPSGYRTVKVLTGFKLFRQRYGTAEETYLAPDDAAVVADVDPDATVPAYHSHAADFQGGSQAYYRRIVRLRDARFHDRYPLARDDSGNPQFAPHRTDGRVGYFEFAYSLPGALWTSVSWAEAKCNAATGALVDNAPLEASDPWDIQVMAQIDNAPAWDDTSEDPATGDPVCVPVHWDQVTPTGRPDACYDPPTYRLKKPLIYLFDDPTQDNHINPIDPTNGVYGQYGDRIRVRVYFKYNPYNDYRTAATDPDAPNYNLPWRTPWVDTLTLRYRAPTCVMEHREMPY